MLLTYVNLPTSYQSIIGIPRSPLFPGEIPLFRSAITENAAEKINLEYNTRPHAALLSDRNDD